MDHRLVYFHHIPFPAPDIFEALPWRENVLHALLQFDLIGFQTTKDQNNFLACLNRCLARVRISTIGNDAVVSTKRRWTKIATYPISVDYESLSAHSCDQAVVGEVEAIRSKMGQTRIILGVDRLDYTKGIPERLFAFRTLLEHNPQLRGKVTLLQFVVPSREQIPEYRDLKIRLERLVSQINGEYATPGWSPIQYFYRSISTAELMAYYRAADIALITPLKDGMNLVAKEFCSARVDSRGVLILSEFAGAAEELKCGALTVNPHDSERMAAVLRKALQMSESEQRMRMETMRSHIRAHDVFHWAQSFDICNFNENAAPNTVQVACS
jgi:trehalose 6-phosphate synthase